MLQIYQSNYTRKKFTHTYIYIRPLIFYFFDKVSYLIVDEADEELEMAEDPFLEAGIDIPPELPYQVTDVLHKDDKLGIVLPNALDVENAFTNMQSGSARISNIWKECPYEQQSMAILPPIKITIF